MRTGVSRTTVNRAAALPITKSTEPMPYCTAACHTGLVGRKHHQRMRASKRYAAFVHGSYPVGRHGASRHGKRGMRHALSCNTVSLLFFLTRTGMRGREGRSVGACAEVIGALQRCAVC